MITIARVLALSLLVGRAFPGEPFPVVPMQMSPDDLLRSLRDRKPLMPAADCDALDLLACLPDEPARVTDISLRWLQLDNDPELEAVMITDAKAEDSFAAYVFDRQGKWNLVGSFHCRTQRCSGDNLIRVKQLTKDSPPLVLCYRDLGGSGSILLTTEGYHLRAGKLWAVFELTNHQEMPTIFHEDRELRIAGDVWVIHTVQRKPLGSTERHDCEVRRWDRQKYELVLVPAMRAAYCDAKSGKPIPGKSDPTEWPNPGF